MHQVHVWSCAVASLYAAFFTLISIYGQVVRALRYWSGRRERLAGRQPERSKCFAQPAAACKCGAGTAFAQCSPIHPQGHGTSHELVLLNVRSHIFLPDSHVRYFCNIILRIFFWPWVTSSYRLVLVQACKPCTARTSLYVLRTRLALYKLVQACTSLYKG